MVEVLGLKKAGEEYAIAFMDAWRREAWPDERERRARVALREAARAEAARNLPSDFVLAADAVAVHMDGLRRRPADPEWRMVAVLCAAMRCPSAEKA